MQANYRTTLYASQLSIIRFSNLHFHIFWTTYTTCCSGHHLFTLIHGLLPMVLFWKTYDYWYRNNIVLPSFLCFKVWYHKWLPSYDTCIYEERFWICLPFSFIWKFLKCHIKSLETVEITNLAPVRAVRVGSSRKHWEITLCTKARSNTFFIIPRKRN